MFAYILSRGCYTMGPWCVPGGRPPIAMMMNALWSAGLRHSCPLSGRHDLMISMI